MSKVYQSVKACLIKTPVSEQVEFVSSPDDVQATVEQTNKETITQYEVDKKTDESLDPSKQPGLIWRMSSGLYGISTGAVTGVVSAGVTSAQWVGSKGYAAGQAVASKMPHIPGIGRRKEKDKNE